MAEGKWPFTIDGVGYPIDPLDENFAGPQSNALMRQQSDTSGRAGESSLNRDDYWRRTITSWHHGAGQKVYDKSDSDPFRFYESQGIDVWTEGELTLLPATTNLYTTAQPTKLLTTPDGTDGTYLWLLGPNLRQFFAPGHAADVFPASAADFDLFSTESITDIATDGYYLYGAAGPDGVFRWEPSDPDAGTAWNTVNVRQLWFVRNRLIAAHFGTLYNILSATAPSALYEHPNPQWAWTGAAEAGSWIYLSGSTGRISQIYKTNVQADDTAELDQPIIATQLPDGEIVQAIYGYAGFVLIGSDRGVRLAQPDGSGFLTYGPLLPLGPITAFEGEGNFVWCGSSQEDALGVIPGVGQDTAHTFLWRLDLSTFIDNLAPAYARDLEGSTVDVKSTYDTCKVTSIATFLGRRYWTQWGTPDGVSPGMLSPYGYVFGESANKVVSGVLRTGIIMFDLTEPKLPVEFIVSHKPLSSTQIKLTGYNDYTTSPVIYNKRTSVQDTSRTFDPWASGDFTHTVASAIHFALTILIEHDATEPTETPTVTALTVKVRPVVPRSFTYVVPVLLPEACEDLTRTRYRRNRTGDFDALLAAVTGQEAHDMTLLGHEFTGYIEELRFAPDGMTRYDREFKGTVLLQIREV